MKMLDMFKSIFLCPIVNNFKIDRMKKNILHIKYETTGKCRQLNSTQNRIMTFDEH